MIAQFREPVSEVKSVQNDQWSVYCIDNKFGEVVENLSHRRCAENGHLATHIQNGHYCLLLFRCGPKKKML